MKFDPHTRRDFLKESAATLAMMALPLSSPAQTSYKVRMEWTDFMRSGHYSALLDALKVMQANRNSSDKNSWQYWVNVHINNCPHGIPYFLAWHRGYIYYFERQLQLISNDPGLTLPYWDYYANPQIPSDFTNSASGNPLYTQRTNTNVHQALTLAPFTSSIGFQRNTNASFEASLEGAPHNPVHDLIGGYMADMSSPMDPIFYLHHANIDRLWYAWALSHPKAIPASTNRYWSGSFSYASGLSINRNKTIDPHILGYEYASNSMPAKLPPQAHEGRIIRVQAQAEPIRNRPPAKRLDPTPPTDIARGRHSFGGVKNLDADENSVSVQITVPPANASAVANIVTQWSAAAEVAAQTASTPEVTVVNVVMDKLTITGQGKKGGFLYNVYLNLPTSDVSNEDLPNYFIGTIGAFEISGASHHGAATLTFAATDVLARTGTAGSNQMTVSLIRVSGATHAKGKVIGIGEIRLESQDPTTIQAQ